MQRREIMRKNLVLALAATAGALSLTAAALAQRAPREPVEPAAPFSADVERLAEQNDDFRRVLHTGPNVQLVLMSLRTGEEIGRETHDVEQCFFVIDGDGRVEADGRTTPLSDGDVACVPGGTAHNVVNAGDEPLKLLTLYSPPEHAPNTVHHTRADAQRAEEREAHG